MGTHPIFESDFDCLTDWKTKSVKSEKHQKLKNNLKPLIYRKISNNIFVLFVYITLFLLITETFLEEYEFFVNLLS